MRLPDPNFEAIARWHELYRDPSDPVWLIVDELMREIERERIEYDDDDGG